MYDRYNIDLNADYLDNVCTHHYRWGMFPTIRMVELYNIRHDFPSIIPALETSAIRQMFAELSANYANDSYVRNRFMKLCGYKNVCYPLSDMYRTLGDISITLRTIANTHDISNYDKFARMIELTQHSDQVPVLYSRAEKWTDTKTETPNETTSTTGEKSSTNITADTTQSENTITRTETNDTSKRKTGTERTDKTNTETNSGTDVTNNNSNKSLTENIVNGVTAFDDENFHNDTNSDKGNTETETGSKSTTYGHSKSDSGNDTITYNTTEVTDNDVSENVSNDTSTTKSITGSDNSESTETKTRTGENTLTDIGQRLINDNMSMAELTAREMALLSIFDTYLLSLANELCLKCVDEVW